MEDKIQKIYNQIVKGKLVHRFRDTKEGCSLKIYYHGQKMYDVYENQIKINDSVLNIPSNYFDKTGKKREKEDYLKELENENPKFELGAIQLVLSSYVQSKEDVHDKFDSFKKDLENISAEIDYDGDIISGLIKELETKIIELCDKNLFEKHINKEQDDIMFFEKVKVNLNCSKEKKIEVLKKLFKVIDDHVSRKPRLFQKPIFYDKVKKDFLTMNNLTDEEKIEAIVNDYIKNYKSKLYDLKDYYSYRIINFTLGISGKLKKFEFKEVNNNNITLFENHLEKYSSYSFYDELKRELDKIENYDLEGELPKISSITFKNPDELSIEDLLYLECLLQFCTIGKPPFKKTEITKEIIVKDEVIQDFNKFNELTEAIKEGIDAYNRETGSLSEKQFQDLLMQPDIAQKLSSKLADAFNIKLNFLPLEEEFVICHGNEKIGRVDNIYVNESKIIFVEVKMNHKVIRYKDHGIAKHLEDMYKWGKSIKTSPNKHNQYIDDMLRGIKLRKEYDKTFANSVKIIDDNLNYDDLLKDYYIICGYEDGIIQDEKNNTETTYYQKILDIINEQDEKKNIDEKKHIYEFMNLLENNDDGIKLNTKIILVKVLKNDQTYYDIDEDSIELVEYNSITDKFEAKKI